MAGAGACRIIQSCWATDNRCRSACCQHLEQESPVPWRGRDWCLCDLDIAQAGETGRGGLAGAMAASRARKAGKADTLPITERDIPIGIVAIITLVCMLPIAWVLGYFANESRTRLTTATLIIGGVAYILLMSFFVSAVCGYMAGLDWFI